MIVSVYVLIRMSGRGKAVRGLTSNSSMGRLSKIAVTKPGLPPLYRKPCFAVTELGFPKVSCNLFPIINRIVCLQLHSTGAGVNLDCLKDIC